MTLSNSKMTGQLLPNSPPPLSIPFTLPPIPFTPHMTTPIDLALHLNNNPATNPAATIPIPTTTTNTIITHLPATPNFCPPSIRDARAGWQHRLVRLVGTWTGGRIVDDSGAISVQSDAVIADGTRVVAIGVIQTHLLARSGARCRLFLNACHVHPSQGPVLLGPRPTSLAAADLGKLVAEFAPNCMPVGMAAHLRLCLLVAVVADVSLLVLADEADPQVARIVAYAKSLAARPPAIDIRPSAKASDFDLVCDAHFQGEEVDWMQSSHVLLGGDPAPDAWRPYIAAALQSTSTIDPDTAGHLLTAYFTAARRVRQHSLHASNEMAAGVINTLADITLASARLCARATATRDDALLAICLYECSRTTDASRFGPNLADLHDFGTRIDRFLAAHGSREP